MIYAIELLHNELDLIALESYVNQYRIIHNLILMANIFAVKYVWKRGNLLKMYVKKVDDIWKIACQTDFIRKPFGIRKSDYKKKHFLMTCCKLFWWF